MSKISGQMLISGQFQHNWEPCQRPVYIVGTRMSTVYSSVSGTEDVLTSPLFQ